MSWKNVGWWGLESDIIVVEAFGPHTRVPGSRATGDNRRLPTPSVSTSYYSDYAA